MPAASVLRIEEGRSPLHDFGDYRTEGGIAFPRTIETGVQEAAAASAHRRGPG